MSDEREEIQAEPLWTAQIFTLYPEMFPGSLEFSLAGKALKKGLWSYNTVDIRDYAFDKYRTVDDTPFGGGAGMVMRPDVVDACISANHKPDDGPLVFLSPRGERLSQQRVHNLAGEKTVSLLCGRFEGIDQRVLDKHNVIEISLGDYILSGGEVAAQVLMDSVIRLLPGVIGSSESLSEESFETGLLEYPHYTRPRNWQGRDVPEVLSSGHHQRVADWRKTRSEDLTRQRRPDLWEKYQATDA